MKMLLAVNLDTETGEYDVVFKNVGNPGCPIEITCDELAPLLGSVFDRVMEQLEEDQKNQKPEETVQ